GRAPGRVLEMRRVLDDGAVDAVIVATPDHWHALATVRACQAGKHVYVEKPPSHNVWEGRKMVEAARKHKRVVQVGTQNRSAPYNLKALEYIRSGALGKIPLVKVYNLKSGGPFRRPPDAPKPEGVDYDTWLGPAPLRPFNPSHFHGGWHAYWTYSGGDLADDGIHQLDLARWLAGLELPAAVQASGGKLAFPESEADVPDTQVATFEFPGTVLTFELTQYAPYMDKIAGDIRMGGGFPYWPQCATRIELYGTKGLMMVGRHGGGWQVFTKAKVVSRVGEIVREERGRFPDPEHKQDFVDAIRLDRLPSADIEEGHKSAVLVHLANIATRLGGRRFHFDARTETIPDDREAAALLKRDCREPFVIPERV
ncbi:MAG: Gfo/Idh/MocA family oxidoreductase, partial [Planctomycetes bacterium]|nr:Gfo/Idh/MocA family oxidoreductase [Planctomycetota bacterium]